MARTFRPLFDIAGTIETMRTAKPAPGWAIGLTALGLAGVTAALVASLSVTAGWLATRLAVGAVIVLVLGLTLGSSTLVGLATAPMLLGATVGLDRPEGHAWGQTLLIGLLWYVTAEVAWAAIEAREATVRSSAVNQLRVREVTTVVLVAALVGLGATAMAEFAPARTVLVRALTIAAVLGCVVGVGQALSRRTSTENDTRED